MKIKFVLFLFTFSLIGCSEKEITPNKSDEYYIKYLVTSNTIYYEGKLDIKLNSELGTQIYTIPQRNDWEITIGPVMKGFDAKINAKRTGWDGLEEDYHLNITTKIEVSKNGLPFVNKITNSNIIPKPECESLYKINF